MLRAGAVYRFDASSGALLQVMTSPSPHFSEDFGYALAVNDDHIVVGAPVPADCLGARLAAAAGMPIVTDVTGLFAWARTGDTLVITAGLPLQTSGGTNVMRLVKVEQRD